MRRFLVKVMSILLVIITPRYYDRQGEPQYITLYLCTIYELHSIQINYAPVVNRLETQHHWPYISNVGL